MLCKLGVGEGDVVVYLMLNIIEMIFSYLGGQIVGIVNFINLLFEVEQIGGILCEIGVKVLIMFKVFLKIDIV